MLPKAREQDLDFEASASQLRVDRKKYLLKNRIPANDEHAMVAQSDSSAAAAKRRETSTRKHSALSSANAGRKR